MQKISGTKIQKCLVGLYPVECEHSGFKIYGFYKNSLK